MLALTEQALLKTASYINGQWLASKAGVFQVVNPASGEVLATVSEAGETEAVFAVEAAAAAQPAWAALPAAERAAIVLRWQQLLQQHEADLALLLTLEQGKPLVEARAEIRYGAAYLSWFAEEAKRVYGDVLPDPIKDKRMITLKQPIGVCAAITPWNFPAAMITRKCAPGLAAGCTFVIKPAEQTPLMAIAFVVLAEKAGFPKGVINIITGDPEEIGKEITSNPKVRKISFTGSTAVGRILMEQSASTVKKLSLELGGNAPFIVFDDCDLDAAVEGLMLGKFRNTGQVCVSPNRIYVQEKIYDVFVNDLILEKNILLSKSSISKCLTESVNRIDKSLMMPIRWSDIGLILRGGWLFGKNKESFGHNGWGGSLGFADPVLGIGVAYTTNKINPTMASDQRIINLLKKFYEI